MSDESTPAFFKASMIACAWSAFLLMASEAVAPFVVTPKSKEALSGVAFAVPLPDTVMVSRGRVGRAARSAARRRRSPLRRAARRR